MLPHVRQVVAAIESKVPVIHFATGNPALLPLMAEAGGQVIGVDWRIDLDDAWRSIGDQRSIQGNLDPLVLLADRDSIRERAKAVLAAAAGRSGHIFNLGHGVLQQTPVENARALVGHGARRERPLRGGLTASFDRQPRPLLAALREN